MAIVLNAGSTPNGQMPSIRIYGDGNVGEHSLLGNFGELLTLISADAKNALHENELNPQITVKQTSEALLALAKNGNEEAKKAQYFYLNQTEVVGDLGFVKGNEWDAGNISYHLDARPKWIYNPGNIFLCNKKLECVKSPFPRITYDEAVGILENNGTDFKYGKDFGAADETIISNQYKSPVMIHSWPVDTKAFYMKRDEDNKDLAKGVDMIAPEGYGEIVGGGQREDDIEILIETIRHHDLPLKPFEWYLDLRRYGSVPHSGFGLGLERFVAWICGTKHIRETIPFPRTMARLEP